MRLGIVGLGKMGSNIAARLTRKGHDVVVWDSSESAVSHTLSNCEKGRCEAVHSLKEVAEQLKEEKRRVIWCMLPAGEVTEETVQELALLLRRGDILIDGGNTYYKDDIRRFREFSRRGLHYIDVGTSGGVWGLERGYCMMIGGEKKIAEYIRPILSALAPGIGDIQRTRHRGKEHHSPTAEEGYLYCGPAGAGHFVKMIHNGIEYGMMQAIAEGFDVLKSKNSPKLPAGERYDLNVADIAEVWRRGSVVTSWLLDLKAEALAHCSDLSGFTGEVADSGEGRWSIEAAIEEDVPVPVMTAALFARFRSRTGNNFTEKALSAMRFGFGGHKEPSRPSDEK